MPKLPFKVDAALLRELGERLVGKPHVALAELIKNAYDADATQVELRVLKEQIEVTDNGHGMDLNAFRDYWMRIGSPHKELQRISPGGRQLTGQKGVGRLAVQFLGRKLDLVTKAVADSRGLKTSINWDDAINAGELTKFEVEYDRAATTGEFPEDAEHGTRLTIRNLTHAWTALELKDLALQIWALQPPFEDSTGFRVTLVDAPADLQQSFLAYSYAFKSIWHARIRGQLSPPSKPGGAGRCEVTITFDDQRQDRYVHEIEACPLKHLEFDIAIYSLQGKQPHGIRVEELREYLRTFGGVSIYDGGFRLPFYGVDTDWPRIQLDHSRRLTRSELLPEKLQVKRGLNFLPTNQRILGSVRVSTSEERHWVETKGKAGDQPLEIAISRDRLIENEAFEVLRQIVRAGLDYYAMREAVRALKVTAEKKTKVDRAVAAVERVTEIVEEHAAELPKAAVAEIKSAIQEATQAVELDTELKAKQANLLGALATAGMAAAALEHEAGRQLRRLEEIAARLDELAADNSGRMQSELKATAREIRSWIDDARKTRQLFMPITEKESREDRQRLRASPLLEQIVSRLGNLLRGIPVEIDNMPPDLRLPSGTFVEWLSLFQNVLVNAANATLDSRERRISISARNEGVARVILVQDTGVGVDLESADELFEPFVRRLKLSPSRRGLGVGGTGLGLAIVRMIAHNLACRVSFTKPDRGFSTAFRLAWSERS